jgi:hypothetical protein
MTVPLRPGETVRLAALGRTGRVVGPSDIAGLWMVRWDRSNITTHERAECLLRRRSMALENRQLNKRRVVIEGVSVS